MRKYKHNNTSGQLRWVILLLVTAVVLPTVCLLWFMGQAIKNERLAVRQKLIDAYEKPVDQFLSGIDYLRAEHIEGKNKIVDLDSPRMIFGRVSSTSESDQDALNLYNIELSWVIYDADGKLLYPDFTQLEEVPDMPELSEAAKFEYEHKDYEKAIAEYERQLFVVPEDNLIRALAFMGKGRCLNALGRSEQAIDAFEEASSYFSMVETAEAEQLGAMSQFRAGEIAFSIAEPGSKQSISAAQKFFFFDYRLSWESSMFVHSKAIEILEPHLHHFDNNGSVVTHYESLKKGLNAYEIAMELIDKYPTATDLSKWDNGTYHRLLSPGGYYGICLKSEKQTAIGIYDPEEIKSFFEYRTEGLTAHDDLLYTIRDDSSVIVLGSTDIQAEPFMSVDIGPYFAGWALDLYFKDSDVFDNAASRQTAIYTWTGVLVIGLMAVCTWFAGGAVGKQMKLNRLKNDFIATVTHELKTPLASMRLLVDTLLEGSYEGQQQAREYLELISKENKRLTGLIDNFLTFSRMERNKQAFELEEVDAADIARAAADSMQTKFMKTNCDFGLDIADDLPMIAADTDAMTTVLINLLDNACKYSREDKVISLNVYRDGEDVCFVVKDNGIGLSLRDTKKIFNRFYQVDSSLTRRTEGTGLGLSIVKFILDAHKATISIDSRPGKGSTFTVKMKGC